MSRVIAIGGGAAGFFGAIACAEQGVGEVLILEKGPEVLTKVRISGGGRCNVTHACFDARELAEHYPRGRMALLGAFHRWRVEDAVEWFRRHSVTLKTEPDGRMFPATDDSRTIIEALCGAARALGVEWRTRCGVAKVRAREAGGFDVATEDGECLRADRLLVATGGIRSRAARKPAEDLGHALEPAVPSLFTFHVEDARIDGLAGVSVPGVRARAGSLRSEGPVLITHWGFSGPAILKLSALGARTLAEAEYRFELCIDWTAGAGEETIEGLIADARRGHGARRVWTRSIAGTIARRLWERLCAAAGIGETTTWASLTREQGRGLARQLTDGRFRVRGKSLNKEEFVTCGGVRLQDVDFRTMESRIVPGVHFAGEILDIDGVTGGFNFQSAWTTARIAGEAIAAALTPLEP